jgi:hypothetical protein
MLGNIPNSFDNIRPLMKLTGLESRYLTSECEAATCVGFIVWTEEMPES